MSKSIKQQLGLSDSNSTSDPMFEAFGICDFSDCSTGKYKKDSIFTVHEQLTHKKVRVLILVQLECSKNLCRFDFRAKPRKLMKNSTRPGITKRTEMIFVHFHGVFNPDEGYDSSDEGGINNLAFDGYPDFLI